MMIVSCNQCQIAKRVAPSRIDGRAHFCSRKCYYLSKQGSISPLNKRTRVMCTECHNGFDAPQYRIKAGVQFCGRICMYKNRDQGLTTANEKIRKSSAYKLWRTSVFTRDNYTCVKCDQVGGVLQADHIKPFALFPLLRLSISNGQTLCVPCHKRTDSFGRSGMFRNLTKVGA